MTPVEYSSFLKYCLWVEGIRQTETVSYFGSEKCKTLTIWEHKHGLYVFFKKFCWNIVYILHNQPIHWFLLCLFQVCKCQHNQFQCRVITPNRKPYLLAVTPKSSAITSLCSVSVCLFWTFGISRIIWYMVSCDWLLSTGFIHVIVCIGTYFF